MNANKTRAGQINGNKKKEYIITGKQLKDL